MTLLSLFLTFFKVGLVSFGGGYGMISLLKEEVTAHGWLSADEFLDFVAVSESTPGPIAINMATFVGSSQAGILGALLATLGVVLPSFFIILLIVAVFKNLLKKPPVASALFTVRPAVAALITGTGATMLLSRILPGNLLAGEVDFDFRALILFALVAGAAIGYKKWKKKKLSPILLIVFSAVLGIVAYSPDLLG